MLTAIPNGFESFNFTITPPSASAVCVLSYTITATPSTTSNVNADRENPSAVIEVTGGGFDLCSYSYTFTVASVTLNGSMESDVVISHVPLSLEGEYHVIIIALLT